MISEVITTPCCQETSFFPKELLGKLNLSRIPRHVALIPDGNRRWAKMHASTNLKGHEQGADTLMEIVEAASEIGVELLTSYIFSTENWNRPQEEVMGLMFLCHQYLLHNQEKMIKKGVRLESIGNLNGLPSFLQKTLEQVKDSTKMGAKITLILALNYGGRDEITRAINRAIKSNQNVPLEKKEITEEMISRHLDTARWPDPELLIRTSGESRMSNFLLWQLSYTEIFISSSYWPDFTPIHFLEAVIQYQSRERRWGGS